MYHNFLHTEPKKVKCPNCPQMNGNNSNKCKNESCGTVFKKSTKVLRKENEDLLAKVAELEIRLALQPRARSVSRGRSVSRDRVNSFDLQMVAVGETASAAAAPSAHAEGRLSDAAAIDRAIAVLEVEQRLGRLCKKLGEMDTDTLGAKLDAIEEIL